MKKFLRRRGADTNQNIFYLVIAVIVVAAAAFGFDQALKAMNRTEARTVATAVSNQTRAMYANAGELPAGLTEDTVIEADVLPSNAVNGADIVLPNGGIATIARNSANTRLFDVTYTWTAASGRGRGICSALGAGATPGAITAAASRVQSGPLGMDYTVTSNTCSQPNAVLVVAYHR